MKKVLLKKKKKKLRADKHKNTEGDEKTTEQYKT